jgi:hypothetical protein
MRIPDSIIPKTASDWNIGEFSPMTEPFELREKAIEAEINQVISNLEVAPNLAELRVSDVGYVGDEDWEITIGMNTGSWVNMWLTDIGNGKYKALNNIGWQETEEIFLWTGETATMEELINSIPRNTDEGKQSAWDVEEFVGDRMDVEVKAITKQFNDIQGEPLTPATPIFERARDEQGWIVLEFNHMNEHNGMHSMSEIEIIPLGKGRYRLDSDFEMHNYAGTKSVLVAPKGSVMTAQEMWDAWQMAESP